MKLKTVLKIIEGEPQGFMVHFEHVKPGILESDYFPDVRHGEKPISTEEEAWDLAQKFAAKTYGKYINIYVIHREDFRPVFGYEKRMIKNR